MTGKPANAPTQDLYAPARGRFAPRDRVEDYLSPAESVVQGRPSQDEFLRQVVRELRIRFYQPKTVKSYRNDLRSFLRWFGNLPHRVSREDVREYLLYLVDAGAASGTVANHLAAVRIAFDKFCHRRVTFGIAVPRRKKTLPVILSSDEVVAILQAAPSLRDKLVLGLMYATGMRVSEVVRLRWKDVDFDRWVINVWQGKGRTDRQVTLPRCYESLLRELSSGFDGDAWLFPGDRPDRHLSPRTAQRIMERAVLIAGIQKRATPHSLRHAFATHSFEDGCDIRRIQKLLGHVRLETTTIYVKVAKPSDPAQMISPLDRLYDTKPSNRPTVPQKPVGRLRFHFKPEPENESGRSAKVTIEVSSAERPIYFTGTTATEVRPGFVSLSIPPLERPHNPLAAPHTFREHESEMQAGKNAPRRARSTRRLATTVHEESVWKFQSPEAVSTDGCLLLLRDLRVLRGCTICSCAFGFSSRLLSGPFMLRSGQQCVAAELRHPCRKRLPVHSTRALGV